MRTACPTSAPAIPDQPDQPNQPAPSHTTGAAVEPDISVLHRRFLSTLVRRTLRDAALDRPPYEPTYVPASLRSINAAVVIRLRQQGVLLAAATAGPDPLAQACRNAALGAYRIITRAGPVSADRISEFLIEIEVVGTDVPLAGIAPTATLEQRAARLEPGVDGFTMRVGDVQRRVCPSEIYTTNTPVIEAMRDLAKSFDLSPDNIGQARMSVFRTTHWYEPQPHGDIVSLRRGLIPVPPSAVTERRLDQAIDRLAEYMIYRQRPSGLFSYEYDVAADAYQQGEHYVRQAGATAAICQYAAITRRDAALAAARKAVDEHLKGLRPCGPGGRAAFIETPDRRNPLGVTALTCMALALGPDADDHAPVRRRLVAGMLWLQQPSGLFVTAFPPAESLAAQDYFPGEALLALATHHHLEPTTQVADAFDRACRWYRERFKARPSPAFIPWQTRAFATMALDTRRRDYTDYVFELTDTAARYQLHAADNVPPDLDGAIAPGGARFAGASTAAFLAGFADALKLARAVGDAEREQRYRRVVLSATRFVLRLEVKPNEMFFARSPRDAIGGIRTAPAVNRVRIDHCRQAMTALIKTRQVLFGDQD